MHNRPVQKSANPFVDSIVPLSNDQRIGDLCQPKRASKMECLRRQEFDTMVCTHGNSSVMSALAARRASPHKCTHYRAFGQPPKSPCFNPHNKDVGKNPINANNMTAIAQRMQRQAAKATASLGLSHTGKTLGPLRPRRTRWDYEQNRSGGAGNPNMGNVLGLGSVNNILRRLYSIRICHPGIDGR